MIELVKIYKITFNDGAAYVGQTIHDLEYRVAHHCNSPSNWELHKRLKRGSKYTVELLCKALPGHAHVVEAREISKLEKPLNITHANGKSVGQRTPKTHTGKMKKWGTGKKIPYPRRKTGQFHCYVCDGWFGPESFYTSKHRSSGLTSRCIECDKHIKRNMSRAKKLGESTSQAYYQAVADIRGNYS